MRTESYSSIRLFKTCRQRYYRKYILKEPDTFDSPELRHGRQVHSLIELKKRGTTKEEQSEVSFASQFKGITAKTPYFCTDTAPSISRICYSQTQKQSFIEFSETKFGIKKTEPPEPTDFQDPEACFRGVIDYARAYIDQEKFAETMKVSGELYLDDLIDRLELYDWKTGRAKTGREQLNLYSLYFFACYPNLSEVSCQVVYLTARQTSNVWKIKREKAFGPVWTKLLTDLDQIRVCDHWSCARSPLCNNCPYQIECEKEGGYLSDSLVNRGLEGLERLKGNARKT